MTLPASGRRRRAAPAQHPDLTWLFCEAEGAVGLRSSFGPLVDLALSGVTSRGGGGVPRGVSDRRLEATGRERLLRACIAPLSTRQRLVLFLAYGPAPWPREIRSSKVYGPWPGVLLLCPRAGRAFDAAMSRATAKATAKGSRSPPLSPSPALGCHGLGPIRDATMDGVAALARRGLGEWLRSPSTLANKDLLEQLRADARELVGEAFDAFQRSWAAPARLQAEIKADARRPPARRPQRVLVPVEELDP